MRKQAWIFKKIIAVNFLPLVFVRVVLRIAITYISSLGLAGSQTRLLRMAVELVKELDTCLC